MTEAAIPTRSSLSPGTYLADQAKVLSRWSEIRADVAFDRKRWPNRGAGNLHQGIEELKRYIDKRRAYLLREIKAQRRRN